MHVSFCFKPYIISFIWLWKNVTLQKKKCHTGVTVNLSLSLKPLKKKLRLDKVMLTAEEPQALCLIKTICYKVSMLLFLAKF